MPIVDVPQRHSERGFLFCKQKTAYEMRISDGSSDVCSSDLINMGTRVVATRDAPVHDNVKRAIVEASELDTRLVMRPRRNTERVLNNRAVEQLLDVEREKGSTVTIDDIRIYVGGVYPRVMMDGETEAGAWSCGMVAGLIDDIPTVAELIDRIMVQADALVRGRLAKLL